LPLEARVDSAALIAGRTLIGDAAAAVLAAVAAAPPSVRAAFPAGYAGWLCGPPARRSGYNDIPSHRKYLKDQRDVLPLLEESAAASASSAAAIAATEAAAEVAAIYGRGKELRKRTRI